MLVKLLVDPNITVIKCIFVIKWNNSYINRKLRDISNFIIQMRICIVVFLKRIVGSCSDHYNALFVNVSIVVLVL